MGGQLVIGKGADRPCQTTYQRTSTRLHTCYAGSRDKSTFCFIEMLPRCMEKPQMAFHVHSEAFVPVFVYDTFLQIHEIPHLGPSDLSRSSLGYTFYGQRGDGSCSKNKTNNNKTLDFMKCRSKNGNIGPMRLSYIHSKQQHPTFQALPRHS